MFLKLFFPSLGVVLALMAANGTDNLHRHFHQLSPIRWVTVPELPRELMLTESVFWEPLDTTSLRTLLRDHPGLVQSKKVLEVGTGSGLLAMCCAAAGAKTVTATDINPNAIQCARRNAARLGFTNIDFRLVRSDLGDDTGAYSVVTGDDHFDLVLSNPPWEDAAPGPWSEYALYDPGFELLRSILWGFRDHANPRAKLMLAYGCVDAIKAARQLAEEQQLQVLVLDDRNPDDLPNLFLPGMVLGIEERDAR